MRPKGDSEDDHVLSRFDRARLRIAFGAHFEPEQVDLVVARDTSAGVIEHETRVADLVGCRRHERDRTADDPDFEPPCRAREEILNRPAAFLLAHPHLVALVHAHDRKILWQRNELSAPRGRLLDQALGFTQVRSNLGTRHHLYGRHRARGRVDHAFAARVRRTCSHRLRYALAARVCGIVSVGHGMTSILMDAPAPRSLRRAILRVSIARAPSQERNSSAWICGSCPRA